MLVRTDEVEMAVSLVLKPRSSPLSFFYCLLVIQQIICVHRIHNGQQYLAGPGLCLHNTVVN